MFKHIISTDLELRLLETRHAGEVFRAIQSNREHLSAWFPWVEGTECVEDTRQFIQMELHRYANDNGFSAGIFYKNRYIGTISFHEINWRTKMTSIGYWLSAGHQGKGIMTECCKEFVQYGFGELGLNRIEIRARTDNEKSIAIPLRLGFKKEGVLRQVDFHRGQYHDHVVFGMLREEWNKLK